MTVSKTANEQTTNKDGKSLLRQMIALFELELLGNRAFMIFTISVCIVYFVEINFGALLPLILAEMNFSLKDIATTLTTQGLSELVWRGLAPYIGEWLHKSPSVMFLSSLMMLVLTRSALLFLNSRISVWILSIFLGAFKALRVVYMNILIANCVSIEKFTAANCIRCLLNGILMVLASPVLGFIKDVTGSYDMCIIFFNIVLTLVAVMIFLDNIITYIKKHKRLSKIYKLEQISKKYDLSSSCM